MSNNEGIIDINFDFSDPNAVLEIELSTGAVINLRPATSSNGNRILALLKWTGSGFKWDKQVARMGVVLDPSVIGDELPTWIKVGGTEVPLAADQFLDEKKGQLKTRRKGQAAALVNGNPMKFSARFSQSNVLTASVGLFGTSTGRKHTPQTVS